MNNCALVCEYNPFHTGHEYQLRRIKELGANSVACVMSGNFVQSAMPAFCRKELRTTAAIMGGADCVIELPALFSTASAGYFADGAMRIISGIKDLTHIAMGATAESDVLFRIAELRYKNDEKYQLCVKSSLKNGKSYGFSVNSALNELYKSKYDDNDINDVFNDPNNILAIEYIVSCMHRCPNIQPLVIKRIGSKFNDRTLGGSYVSATAIRNNFGDRRVSSYIPYMEKEIRSERELHSPDINAFNKMCVFALRTSDERKLIALRDCSDGMEHLIKNIRFGNADDILNSEKMKKYGQKRIRRLMLDCLLDIRKELLDKPFVTRLLGCRSEFDFSILPDCVKTTNKDIKKAAKENQSATEVLEIDIRASVLYETLCGTVGDYFNYSLVKL